MTWKMALFTYVNLWWLSLFFVWPFSVEAREKHIPAGEGYSAAPKRIYWKKMLILTSIVGAILTALLAIIIYLVKQGT